MMHNTISMSTFLVIIVKTVMIQMGFRTFAYLGYLYIWATYIFGPYEPARDTGYRGDFGRAGWETRNKVTELSVKILSSGEI